MNKARLINQLYANSKKNKKSTRFSSIMTNNVFDDYSSRRRGAFKR